MAGEEKPEAEHRDADQEGQDEEVKPVEDDKDVFSFHNCLCLGDVDQTGAPEPEQTEASHLTPGQDTNDSEPTENDESPRSASPTQTVMLKFSLDPERRCNTGG